MKKHGFVIRPPHFSARAPRTMTYCDISVGSDKTIGKKTSGIKLEDNLRTRVETRPEDGNERVHSSYQAVTSLTIRIAQTHIPCQSRQSDMTPEDPTELLGVSNG